MSISKSNMSPSAESDLAKSLAKNMQAPKNILVVGGGISGMCAAIMLARCGRSVHLVDADPDWRALGAGMTLNWGALRAFDQMGLLDQVKQAGWCLRGPTLCAADGTVLFSAGDQASPMGSVPMVGGIMRPVLHRILQDEIRRAGVVVLLAKSVSDLNQDEKNVEVGFSDGSRSRFDFVIGADGIYSTVRSLLFPGVRPYTYVGMGCWRAVVPRPDDVLGPVTIAGRQAAGVNPVSREEMYLFLNHHVPDNRWMPEDRWVELLKAELDEFTAPLVRNIADNLSGASLINYRPVEAGILPEPWFKGRVLLVGDAVHVPTPHSAFGAGLGIEDGIALAEELEADADLSERLSRYTQRRFGRCKKIVDLSLHVVAVKLRGANAQETGAAARALTDAIVEPF